MEVLIIKPIEAEQQINWPRSLAINEQDFFRFCAANPDIPFERDKHGNIVIMPPTAYETGGHEATLGGEIYVWNKRMRLGRVLSASTGFTLPSGAVRSPDAAWVSAERDEQLTAEERGRFAHIVPDFVGEVRSRTDSLSEAMAKMEEYMEAGVRLAFLVDRGRRKAWVYRAGDEPELFTDFDHDVLSGENILPGFELHLSEFK